MHSLWWGVFFRTACFKWLKRAVVPTSTSVGVGPMGLVLWPSAARLLSLAGLVLVAYTVFKLLELCFQHAAVEVPLSLRFSPSFRSAPLVPALEIWTLNETFLD